MINNPLFVPPQFGRFFLFFHGVEKEPQGYHVDQITNFLNTFIRRINPSPGFSLLETLKTLARDKNSMPYKERQSKEKVSLYTAVCRTTIA